MKKSTIIIFLVLAMLKTQAQDYLISFTGAGATTSVGTVKVDNLTSGTTVTLNSGDILHLAATLGINNPATDNGTIQVYPNPMAEQAILTFIVPEKGDVDICLVDMDGRTIYQISKELSPGSHSFRVSGVREGMYSLKVAGPGYSYSAKLISQSNSQRAIGIEYISSNKNALRSPLKNSLSTIDMKYTTGDQLTYKGISGIYSTIVADMPVSSKTITFNFVACTDEDGNNYATVQIGEGKSVIQTWMAENLRVGIRINANQAQTGNGIIEKYCYNDDEANCAIYGGLYQWKEMMQYATTPGVKGICPTGWHLPTDDEWTALTDFLGGVTPAGAKLKETGTAHWQSPDAGATNSSGFTGLPGGWSNTSGDFGNLNMFGFFWASSQIDLLEAWIRKLNYDIPDVNKWNEVKTFGHSARCIKD